MVIYNDKWLDIIRDEKYQKIRDLISETFKDLRFVEEGHRYFVGERELTCVSNVTHMFKEEFNTDIVAERTFNKHYKNPESVYFNKTADEIKKMWIENSRRACEHGTERHLFGENLCYFMMGDYDSITVEYKDRLKKDEEGRLYFEAIYPKEIAALKFWNDMPRCYVPIMPETKVYRKDLGYSGTFDLLVYYDATLNNKTEEKSGLIIMDWKTNKDLYKCYGNNLLEPFNELKDMPVSLYKLQQSLYELALTHIGLKVVGRMLMWLLETGEYEKVPLESYSLTLENELRKRQNI